MYCNKPKTKVQVAPAARHNPPNRTGSGEGKQAGQGRAAASAELDTLCTVTRQHVGQQQLEDFYASLLYNISAGNR